MESFLARYRNLVVLLVVLVAQIAGLAVQVRRTGNGPNTDKSDMGGVRLIRLWANAVISPPEQLIHASKLGALGLWTNYLDLRHVREQNKDLQKTIDRLRLEQASLLEDARQGQRLQAMLGFQQSYMYSTVAAQVYGSSGTDRSHIFYIDKGSSDGLKPDMAVITGDGIVGKVRDVFPHSAQILAVNDSTSGAGVILENTRIRGILRGDREGRLEIVGLMADQRIQPGEHILTAGGDLIFPRGLPVGSVARVVRDPERDGFIDIMVNSSAHLDRLDEVLVITSTQPRFPPQSQQDLAESEAEKGAEAQALKDQMKASQIMAEKLPGLVDPKLPADQQPLHDSTPPSPNLHPPQPMHPDRFTPGSAVMPTPSAATSPATQAVPVAPPHREATTPTPSDKPQAAPQRNP
jgi:rod shape-determining protein MreC